jgi:uncharacterized membrane protein YphA (DoxX/SURF4 family)
MDILFLIGRVLFGGFFVFNGLMHFMKMDMMKGFAASKGVPAAGAAVAVSGVMLLLGGLGILLGAYVQVSVWLLVAFLLIAAVKIHDFWNQSDEQAKMTNQLMFMRNLALTGAALMMLMLANQVWPYALNL